MIHDIIVAIWFFLPSGAANVAPVLVAKANLFESLALPLDGGAVWRGRRVFGDNKTWRGLMIGIFAAIIVLGWQQILARYVPSLDSYFASIDYLSLSTILLGSLFAVGALGGDAIESFFKRLRGIKPGQSWMPFDQLDYIIGSILLTLPLVVLTASQYAWAIICWFTIHLLVSFIGFKLGFKDRPI